MIKTIVITPLLLVLLSCGRNQVDDIVSKAIDNNTDTTANKVSTFVKAMSKAGELTEIKEYRIGTFKKIKFDIFLLDQTSAAIMLTTTYEDRYYYRTIYSFVALSEVDDFINSLKKIKDDYLYSTPETRTIVGFLSDGGARIKAEYKNGNWICYFHVDYNYEEAGCIFTSDDIEQIVELFKKSKSKIIDLIK